MTHSSASQKCFMAALISIACWIPVVAQAQDSPPNPAEVTVNNIAFRGDACRTGTFVWNLSSDAKAFTLLFSEFAVSADPTATKARKLCELDIQMRIPSGWSFALLGVDIRGYAGLKNEVSRGHVRAVYAFGRSRNPTLLAAQNFQGPFDQDYVLSSDANVESYNWSPCGGTRIMRVRTHIAATVAPGGPNFQSAGSLLTVDSIDGEVEQKYGIIWKKCTVAVDPGIDPPLPDLTRSQTATCVAVQRQGMSGSVLQTYTGSGSGFNPATAKQAAQMNALRLCRAQRHIGPERGRGGHGHNDGRGGHGGNSGGRPGGPGGPGGGCTVDPQSCTVVTD